jgi:hypothetical protein
MINLEHAGCLRAEEISIERAVMCRKGSKM